MLKKEIINKLLDCLKAVDIQTTSEILTLFNEIASYKKKSENHMLAYWENEYQQFLSENAGQQEHDRVRDKGENYIRKTGCYPEAYLFE